MRKKPTTCSLIICSRSNALLKLSTPSTRASNCSATNGDLIMKRNALLLSILILLSLSAAGCSYNTLQTKHQNVKAKWSNVENQLQRRSDLLNNLIETAKLSGVQEQEVFGTIAEARSKLLNATQQAPQGQGGDKTPEQKQAVIDAANSFGGT